MAEAKSVSTGAEPGAADFVQVLLQTIRSPYFGSILALAAALALGAGLIISARSPSYTPVLEKMGQTDPMQVISILNSGQYDHKVDAATGVILVPRDQLAEIRLRLSAEGIGDKNDVGLELLQQDNSLGTSQFMESARYQHALETELSRTISSMRYIQKARVHLAIPKQSVFIRNREKASASVMVQPIAGNSIGTSQVSSIVNLVASSIPYLDSSQVTVVDQWGQLLSSSDDGGPVEQTHTQFEYTRKIENLLMDRVNRLLLPLVGEGSVRTSVTADVDFTLNEQTQEIFDADPAQIRSEKIKNTKTGDVAVAAAGVPGALTNQPDGALPIATEVPGREGLNSQSTTNYELDKTIRHTKQAYGSIRRLSVAVLIDDKMVENEAGEIERVAVSAEEIEQITLLVKEAVGFMEPRGDSVSVINRSFQPLPEIQEPEPLPFYEQIWMQGLVKQGFAGFAVLMLIFMVLRPAMKNLRVRTEQLALEAELSDEETPDESEEDDRVDDEAASGSLPPPKNMYGDIIHVAQAMAKEDPERVARVVRDWVEKQDG